MSRIPMNRSSCRPMTESSRLTNYCSTINLSMLNMMWTSMYLSNLKVERLTQIKKCWIFTLVTSMMSTLLRLGTQSFTMLSLASISRHTCVDQATASKWWTSSTDTTCLRLVSMESLMLNFSRQPDGLTSFSRNPRVTPTANYMIWIKTSASQPLSAWWEITMPLGQSRAMPTITSLYL